MAKAQKVNYVSLYKKLAKEKKAKKEQEVKTSQQEVIHIACGGSEETIVIPQADSIYTSVIPNAPVYEPVCKKEYIGKNEYKPLSSFYAPKRQPVKRGKGFRRDLKKLHKVWDYVKTHNLILKAFSCFSIINGRKIENPHFPRYVKFLKVDDKFWIINANYKFDITKVLPKNEVIGAHIYKDGNMQFTTKYHMFITCEPYYGKPSYDKVEKDAKE